MKKNRPNTNKENEAPPPSACPKDTNNEGIIASNSVIDCMTTNDIVQMSWILSLNAEMVLAIPMELTTVHMRR